MRRTIWALMFAFCLLPDWTLAQKASVPEPVATLSGAGIQATTLTPASLAGLPTTQMDVSFQTSKGEEKGHFEGVLLWDILTRAGLLEGAGHHDELRRAFTVTGRDGYAILFSIGEIEPDFGGTPILVALKRDGRPFSAGEGLRLIVPGDKRGARSVRNVATIELR